MNKEAKQSEMKTEGTTFKIDIPVAAMKAILPFASRSPLRDTLGCVHVERKGGVVSLVATDGHVLAVIEMAIAGDDFTVDLRADTLRRVCSIAPKDKKTTKQLLAIEGDKGVTEVRTSDGFSARNFPSTRSLFPDYRRVLDVKTTTPTSSVIVNPRLLAMLANLVKDGDGVSLTPTDDNGPVLFEARNNSGASWRRAYGAVMPMRA